MTTGTKDEKDEEMRKMGLVAAHAYALISVKKVKDKTGKDANLCMLRNPWGNFEWKGQWNDESDEWTPELKEELGFIEGGNDGLFWIKFEHL